MSWHKPLDDFCGESLWNYELTWNTTYPELTPCMEATVLVWIPCSILWILTPLQIYFLYKSTAKKLPWSALNISKMVIAAALAIVCAADILDGLFNRRSEPMFVADMTGNAIKGFTFVLALVLIGCNRRKGLYTSGVLFIFWTVLTIAEVIMYRSAFLDLRRKGDNLDENRFVEEMIYFPLTVAQLILSCFAEKKHRYLTYKAQKECPELSASFLSQISFHWFSSMAYLGWKRPLVIGDLWQLNPDDRTDTVIAKFNRHCNYHHVQQRNHTEAAYENPCMSSSEKFSTYENPGIQFSEKQSAYEKPSVSSTPKQKKKTVNIVPGLCKAFWSYFAVGALCKAVYDLLQFLNPLILKLIIDYVKSDDPLWKGLLFAFMMLGNGCLQSFILGHYFHRMFVLGMRVRTALVSAIYRKSLALSSKAKRESTVGEIVNLMSVDSQRFIDLMAYLNLLWSAPLQIIVALVLLWKILGPSVLAGLSVMVVLLPANAYITSKVKTFQVKQMDNKDERVKLVNEILSGIKVLKLYAWEEAFQDCVFKIRNKEVNELKNISYLNSVVALLWNCSPFLVSLATFATYVLTDENNVLDASKAFVSLSLFNILRFPLTMLPYLITNLVMASVSVKRINKYMASEELTKYVLHNPAQESAVIIRNGHFAWSHDEKPILKNINLSVSKGSLVAVVGQVGAGKSSLIAAALGDMDKIQGTVSINGSTALVSQQPWIQNDTLKNNILFSHEFKRSKYHQVLDACSLLPDLAILPGGDETEIGEKGINLSGGQKQRVSVARAVYSDRDIYLLDDPLSAVDSHVGRHIFDRVIGPKGLLRDKTRILVTHSLTYLPQVDVIVVIKDGSVAEMGSFQYLIERKGPFAEYLSQYMQDVGPHEEDLEVLESIGNKNPELLRSLSEISSEFGHHSDSENRRSSVLSVNRKSSLASSLGNSDAKGPEKMDQLIQKEVAETGEVKFSVYLDYFRAVGWTWIAVILVTYIFWQIFSVYSNVWLSEWGNDKAGPNVTENIAKRNMRLGVYGGLGLGQAIFIFLGTFGISYGTVLAAKSIHHSLLQNVLRSPMSFFDTTPQGRIVNRFSKDIDTVDVTIPMTLRSWLSCLLQVLSTIAVISVQTPVFLSIILPVGVLYYLIQKFYVSTSRQLKRLESITRSPIYSHFSETLSGTSTIRSFGAEERFCLQSDSLVDQNQVCYYPSIVSNRWLSVRLDFCGNNITFFASLFAILGRGTLEPGEVGLSISYALMVTATLNWLVRMSSELETNIVAVERVIEYTKTPTEAEWVLPNKKMPKNWPITGNVQLDNYSTRYREGLDLVLKGISCDILPGEKVGIVGRTGAGKSSLTMSLFRIIEAAGGSIKIDGVDVGSLGLHDLRSRITIIPQDPVLFSGTLRMNLDPFNWYSDTHVWESLDHAHLKEFVSSLPQGLLHEVVEGGENLSVGQRQLVCLARALLRKTKILVLDEATAAVDLETDDLIQATIRREFSDSTVLTIAHRLNTVMDYDRIMVLDNGNVAEFESPRNLLADRKSIFYGMAKDAGLV